MSEAQDRELMSMVQQLTAEVMRVRERVEDLADARELDAAINRNAEKSLLSWAEAKNELGIT